MRELGQALRDRREQLGIDLDELQARTKIRKRYLIAIEDGNWSVLPGDVYARGFIRSYAECVGLDGRHLLELYGQSGGAGRQASTIGKTSQSVPAEKETPSDESNGAPNGKAESTVKSQQPQSSAPLALTNYSNRTNFNRKNTVSHRPVRSYGGQVAAVVGILVVLGGGLWALKTFTSGATPQPSSPISPSNITGTAGNQTAAVGNQTNSTQNNTTTQAQSGNQLAAGQSGNSADNNASLGNQTGGAQRGSVQITAQPPSNGSATYLVTTADPLTVSVTASQRCWVAATVDGKSTDGGGGKIIDSGQTSQWTAKQVFKIRIGNVPAAQITVNGQPLTLPATNTPLDIYVMKPQTH